MIDWVDLYFLLALKFLAKTYLGEVLVVCVPVKPSFHVLCALLTKEKGDSPTCQELPVF